MHWSKNPKIQFAVGITVIILLARWLFTGDLLLAGQVAMAPEDSGEEGLRSIPFTSIVGSMFWEAGVIVGASVIGWMFKIWDQIYEFLSSRSSAATSPVDSVPSIAASTTDDNPLVLLGQAVAMGDSEKAIELQRKIRLPYATRELVEAYQTGNMDAAKELQIELATLVGKK